MYPKRTNNVCFFCMRHKTHRNTYARNFKIWFFSKHRPSGPMVSISRNEVRLVCLSVCLSVRVFTYEVLFKRLFTPTSRSWMSNIFRDSECLGKRFEIFVWKWSKIAKQRKIVFLADFALQNKVETTIPDGLETSGQRAYF